MREDEHGWDPKGPPTLIDLEAALDAHGSLIAVLRVFSATGWATPVALIAATLAGLPHEMTIGPGASTTRRYPTPCRICEPSPTGWRQRLSGPRGFEPRAASKIPLPMNHSSMSSRRRQAPIRSNSGCAISRMRGARNSSSASRRSRPGRERLRSRATVALESPRAGLGIRRILSWCGPT